MMQKLRNVVFSVSLTIALGGLLPTTPASELPDSELNPSSGNIELVDSTWNNGQWDIRHVVDRGQGIPSLQTLLSVTATVDSSPRIAITESGVPGVAWFSEGEAAEVIFRARPDLTGDWNGPTTISEKGIDSRRPSIVADGGGFWIGFEAVELPGETDITVCRITDDFEPIPTLYLIDTAGYAGDRAIMLNNEDGHLWISWVHSPTEVGWAEHDYETDSWNLAQYEPNPDDDTAAARARIRERILSGQ